MKTCSKCGLPGEFAKRKVSKDGLQHQCKSCRSKIIRALYKKNRKDRISYSKEYRKTHYKGSNPRNDKVRAREAVKTAIVRGKITKPDACSKCGSRGKIQAHHDDYLKKLDVIWLCTVCHAERHWVHKD